jgi:O-antigen/teichoic acid export membrane protein
VTDPASTNAPRGPRLPTAPAAAPLTSAAPPTPPGPTSAVPIDAPGQARATGVQRTAHRISEEAEPEPIGRSRQGDHTADDTADNTSDDTAEDTAQGLELMLEEIDSVVEPVAEAASMAPAVGIAVAGGPMITLPDDDEVGPHIERHHGESLRGGIMQAGPVAVAGLLVNGLAVVVVVLIARLVSPRAYGTIAVLLGLFFILSMPGSAVQIGVVRRVTIWQKLGEEHRVHPWAFRVYRMVAGAVVVEAVVVWLAKGFIAHALRLPNTAGVFAILVAAGIWMLLSVDRGLLQAHRDYRGLAGNLLVEGVVRCGFAVGLVAAGFGVGGYAIGIFIGEAVAAAHARWLAGRAWPAIAPAGPERSRPPSAPAPSAVARTAPSAVARTAPSAVARTAPSAVARTAPAVPIAVAPTAAAAVARRALLYDVTAAFVGLALLALLQNVDVLILGRQAGNSNIIGSYAAISVASKALVFGALALGSYLLPEATIRWNEGGHALRQLGVTLLFLAVPAALLLGISIFIPKQFITLFFSAKLSTASSAFAPLVGAMIFLAISVLLTNYLFGAGRRWVVLVLAAGAALSVVLVAGAHGNPLDTAKADLIVQAALACSIGCLFIAIHRRVHRSR